MSDLMPPELAKACAGVRAATPADAVSGQPARFVASPASTQEAASLLHAAAELNLTVVPRGTGSRIDWGQRPRACDLIVDTSRLDAVVEHAAGDLVVRVQAGVRLDDLQDKLAAEGQRLALDPRGGGTIGGLAATGVAGPLRFRYGAPRDLLIGITVVLADGTVAKAGGKVVKNVAGYDLGKLFAGSYGTLGLITEATFRLHPAPASSAAVALDCPDPASAAAAAQTIASSPLTPSAIELAWPATTAPITVAVLLEGDESSVTERADRARSLLTDGRGNVAAAVGPFPLGRTPAGGAAAAPDQTMMRIAFWPGQLASVLGAIREAAEEQDLDPAISGSAAGVLQVDVRHEAPATDVVKFVTALRAGLGRLSGPAGGVPPVVASAVVLRAPAAVRDAVEMWGPVPSLDLMRRVKDQFDPEHRMAPGRFAGGI